MIIQVKNEISDYTSEKNKSIVKVKKQRNIQEKKNKRMEIQREKWVN